MSSLFGLFSGHGGSKEHGKHYDIKTREGSFTPMEQTWMEYKQNSNLQNEYPTSIFAQYKSKIQGREFDEKMQMVETVQVKDMSLMKSKSVDNVLLFESSQAATNELKEDNKISKQEALPEAILSSQATSMDLYKSKSLREESLEDIQNLLDFSV